MKPGTEVLITRPGWEGKAVIKNECYKDFYTVLPEHHVSFGLYVVFHKSHLKTLPKKTKKRKK